MDVIHQPEKIMTKIYVIRGKKVMFASDLAELYQVETRSLNQAIKRNVTRFPDDFSFILNKEEKALFEDMISRSQIVILKQGKNIKYAPRVFTEQGVAMLSSVLNSERAIQVNIQIIRTFSRLREIFLENEKLSEKLIKLEQKYDSQIAEIFLAIDELTIDHNEVLDEPPKEKIGFNPKT